MKKCKFSKAVVLCLLLSMMLSMTKSNAATKYVSTDSFNKSGRVTNITKSKVVYRTQTGSSPESWARPKTLTISSTTKFYKCMGYNSSYTKWKMKSVSKAAAIKAVYNNGSNYVFFKTSGKKVKILMYGMENYVG